MFQNLFLKSTAVFIGLFLLIFLAVPIIQVFYVSFLGQNGQFTLVNFYDFFQSALFIESFYNSFYVAAMSVVLASLFAIPLAYFTARFNFKGSVLIQSLGFIPSILPKLIGPSCFWMALNTPFNVASSGMVIFKGTS